MKTSQAGIDLIKSFEGCKLHAYQDAGKIWTIGYGHTNGVIPGMYITQDIADCYLREDLGNAERYVGVYDRIYHFTQNQFDALVSFTYNAGAGNLKKLLNGGNKPLELVHEDLLTCCIRSKGRILNGLIRRRNAEYNLMGNCSKDIDLVVYEVMSGMWGNGLVRKKNLTNAGYDYKQIQEEINKRVKK